jgi:glucan phosphorylase
MNNRTRLRKFAGRWRITMSSVGLIARNLGWGDTNMLEEFLHQSRIAYSSLEIARQDDIPVYSGGFGVFAGDTTRSAVNLELPLVDVTLLSRADG